LLVDVEGRRADSDPPQSDALQSPHLLTPGDLESFSAGRHFRAYEKLGAHLATIDGVAGTFFAVWAPNAQSVSVIGDFNQWDRGSHPLQPAWPSGIWSGFVPGVAQGTRYKYHIVSRYHGHVVDKTDPFAFAHEVPPRTASIVWDLSYEWGDAAWMKERKARQASTAPMSIYEVHLGSWRRVPEEANRSLTYRELAPLLADYARQMNFTHVEFLPITEHPFFPSWGYQSTGFFAPTSRYGTPQDFMFLMDYLHQQGIGVILDWVPSHFPRDAHALAFFDGTHLFEHADPRLGFHPDWTTAIFNYGRNEVRSFLTSSAIFWLEKYHIDGLRIDAVASMLFLDFSRKPGQWLPNRYGGRENLDAAEFLRQLNLEVGSCYPDVLTIAEESHAWPKVSRPVAEGGLGFSMKWDMGWMNDTLKYFKRDPVFRKHYQNELTFRMLYAWTENFVLPLSHDEVVHMKRSLYGRMPGDEWQKYANLRLLFGLMYAQPGKKLLFMGDEFGQWPEWNHESSVQWHALADRFHAGVQKWVADLNHLYRAEPALHELDFQADGFEWIDHHDAKHSVLSFMRKGRSTADLMLAVFNFTPVVRANYRLGAPRGGLWQEILNSDANAYGGGNLGNAGGVEAENIAMHRRPFSLRLCLPPLSALLFINRAPVPILNPNED
jgi:1,4-alpha-glucan branching enzyme